MTTGQANEFPIPSDFEGFGLWDKMHCPKVQTPMSQDVFSDGLSAGFTRAMDEFACPIGVTYRPFNYYVYLTTPMQASIEAGSEPFETRLARYGQTIAGQAADRFGRRILTLFGGVFQVIACLSLVAAASTDQWEIFLGFALILIGASVGVGMNVATVAAVESAPKENAGSAAGTTSLLRYSGSIIGAGLLGLILSTDSTTPSTDVFRLLYTILLLTAGVVTFLSLSIHRFVEADVAEGEDLAVVN